MASVFPLPVASLFRIRTSHVGSRSGHSVGQSVFLASRFLRSALPGGSTHLSPAGVAVRPFRRSSSPLCRRVPNHALQRTGHGGQLFSVFFVLRRHGPSLSLSPLGDYAYMSGKQLPDWLRLWFQSALLGEIYPSIRAIAVGFSPSRALTLRAYFDREPTADDHENMSCVLTEIFANTSSNAEITAGTEECVFSEQPIGRLDPLDGFVYARREYNTTVA